MISIRDNMRQKNQLYIEQKKSEHKKNEEILEKRKEFNKQWGAAIAEKKKVLQKKYAGKIFTKHIRPDKDWLTLNSGEILVETNGYIPLQEQVQRLERAGVNLQDELSKNYDFSPKDQNDDGFKDGYIMQYPDKIEAFEILQDIQIKELSAKLKEKEVKIDEQKTMELTPPNEEKNGEKEPQMVEKEETKSVTE